MATFDVVATSFGYIESKHAVYATAREGSSGTAFSVITSAQGTTGQFYNTFGPFFQAWETMLAFDLTGFTSITSATLAVGNDADRSTTDFIIEARVHPWTSPIDATDWVPGSGQGALTLAATYDTSTGLPAVGSYYSLVGDVAAHCPPGGEARFVLCSSRHRLGTVPAGLVEEWVYFDLPPNTPPPKLIIDGSKGEPWSVGSIRIA